MIILGVNGGNGVILHPMRRHLVANYEPRSLFRTKDDIQWKLNFKAPIYSHKLDFYNNFNKGYIKDIDCIVSAPDCGHSSILAYSRAKKLSNPKGNYSLNLTLRSILMVKPKVFMMENLPKVSEGVDFRETFPDYNLVFLEHSVNVWGNSQKNRIRLVLIGLRKDAFKKKKLFMARDHFTNIYKINEIRTCEELLVNLEEEDHTIGHVRENINDTITLYAGFKDTLYNIQKHWESNTSLRRWGVTGRNFSTAPGVYRNLNTDLPATARKANRQFNSKGLQMSPRELARIQGVPDSFKLHTPVSELKYWVNKGRTTVTKTPPYEIGKWFYNQLKEVEKLWKL